MNYLSQILGVFAFIFYLFSIQNRDKKKILSMQLVSNVFYTISYFLINAMSAVVVDFISFIRCIIYYIFAKRKKKIPLIYMFLLVLISIIVGLFIVKDFFDVIPIVICIIYIVSTYFKNIRIIQIGYILGACLWIVYNLHAKTYTPLIGNVFEIISGVISIIRIKKSK